ncbi:copine i-like protein, putative [Bodo saltans]|uniref:Copine i-like protein, putative n=1 Tax=Bodo saltans TaxID=75058 RepID=A0A0S4JTD9_BODSA|nr:copine i-like protein, putative [Bodo saltans]|eukprot:CUG93539.1 copine i-like protein, putative [Bodo saltans]
MNVGTKCTLYFKCQKLKDTDTFSKSDPYVVLYRNDGTRLSRVGRTETINNNLNPIFQTTIEVEYFFETKQDFVLKLYDYDGHKNDDQNDALGVVTFTLAHIMCSRGHTKEFPIPPPGKGSVTITAVDHAATREDTIELHLYGRKMRKMDFIGASDPYYTLHRLLPNKQMQLLYTSEVISDNLNPDWKPQPKLRVGQLMGADSSEKTILLQCYDKDVFGHKGMGSVIVSVDDLLNASHDPNLCFPLVKENKKQNQYGNIHVKLCKIVKAITFSDLLSLGWQVNMVAAVDFTASNGDPKDLRSLHFYNPQQPNEYVRAMWSVGEILMDYDSDKNIPAFGFGAMMPDGQVSHHFHLNLEPNPYVQGMPGLLDAYQRAISTVKLYGPTNFAPTIQATAVGARQAEVDHIYTILLIITDGEITDIDDTIDALVDADDVAMSIIIVGVGHGCDFAAMDQLDGDNAALVSRRGRRSRRDLVQFVPMREFANRPPAALAAEVLREVPAQVERWALIKGMDRAQMFPNVPVQVAPSAPPPQKTAA